jgi:hypothetical protein
MSREGDELMTTLFAKRRPDQWYQDESPTPKRKKAKRTNKADAEQKATKNPSVAKGAGAKKAKGIAL